METPIVLACHYGLRRSEIVGLQWNAIDFNYKTITVRRTVTEEKWPESILLLKKKKYITYQFPIPRLLDENYLRKIRFHDLRYSCATLLRHNGVAMKNIQKWLGYPKLETTSMIYAHFDDKELTFKVSSFI